LRIKEAGKINLISRSSTINIDQVRELKTDSRRDKVFIGGLSEATGSGYFTDFDITTIDNSANLSLRYGRIHIDSVKQGFSLLSLSSEYTDMNLGFSGSPDFHFDLTQDREVTFIYPKKYATLEQAVVNEESGTVNHTGFFGQGNDNRQV
jgi:hypothetical protein